MAVDTETLKVGDTVVVAEPGRSSLELTVWMISPPGEGGVSFASGPKIWAHIRPGGYGITFDRDSHLYPYVALPGQQG